MVAGTPKEVKHLHPSGFEEVLVMHMEQLKGINPETQAARISAKLGAAKRQKIVAEAIKMKLKILNP